MVRRFNYTGWQYASTSFSTQIVAMVTLVGSLLCYTAYAASIVSLLSVDYNPIRDINDLLSHGYTLYANRFSVTALQYAMVAMTSHVESAGTYFACNVSTLFRHRIWLKRKEHHQNRVIGQTMNQSLRH